MNLPNKLALGRIAVTPLFVAALEWDTLAGASAAFMIFVFACVTDWLDGRIARSRNLVTDFGKLVDPVADKVLMIAAFVMLMPVEEIAVPAWCVWAVLSREVMVTGVRAFAASKGQVLAADWRGKVKTTLQMVYVTVFLAVLVFLRAVEGGAADLHAAWQPIVRAASLWAMVGVAVFTVYSAIHSLVENWDRLSLGHEL